MTQPSTKKPTVSFQRERNPYGRGVVDGRNGQLYAAARKGADKHLVWARPGVGDSTVGDYRSEGYEPVSPKDVETMRRGQYFPQEKDVGVYLDFDKRGDRVVGPGGLVLMWAPQSLIDEIKQEHRDLGESYRRKETRAVDQAAAVDFGTEVTTTVESLDSM